MFWFFDDHAATQKAADAAHATATPAATGHVASGTTEHAATGAAAEHAAEGAAHHSPPLVELVNSLIGKPVHDFQMAYTKPAWDALFGKFGTNAETVFGAYTVENAVPWYTVMFFIACVISVIVIALLKRKLSEDEPSNGQQILETGVLAIRQLLTDNVGAQGMKYFPVIGTFAVLILVSNLMALFPGLMPPTASTSVTFALGISSFIYYNFIGIKENGLFGHLRHFAGPVLLIAPLMFPIEIISNIVRPVSLGVRLFGNIFSDEQVATSFSALYPPLTYFIIPALLMPLTLFVSLMQTFIFVLLSILYISEVTHGDHGEHDDKQHDHADLGHAYTEGEQPAGATALAAP